MGHHQDPFPLQFDRLVRSRAIVCPVAFYAGRSPDQIAVRTASHSISYRKLNELILGAQTVLRSIDSCHRLAISDCTDLETLVWMWAAFRSKTHVFLVNNRLPLEARSQLLLRTGVDLLVSGAHSTAHKMPSISGALPEQLADAASTGASLDLEPLALLIQTSGSTGYPKIAGFSLGGLFASAAASNTRIPLLSRDRWLLALPLYHVAGLGIVFRTLSAGASIGVYDSLPSVAQALSESQSSYVSLVSTQLVRLLEELQAPTARLKEILVGGGPIPAAIVRRAVEAGFPIRTTYGMTEMSSQISTSSIWTQPLAAYSNGSVLPGVELTINSDSEISVRGPSSFLGYLNADGKLANHDKNQWIATGDCGYLEKDSLFVTGRKDQMFVSGGENIHPEEIELEMLTLDSVEAAIVVPVVDAEFGFRPVAFVRYKNDHAEPGEIVQFLRSRLPAYKVPRELRPWPEELSDASLKWDRKFFLDRARSGQESAIDNRSTSERV